LTCVPSPSEKRPRLARANSHAVCAVIIGLRGNATAIAVPIVIDSVTSAATAHPRYGGRFDSVNQRPENPSSSTERATEATSSSGRLAPYASNSIATTSTRRGRWDCTLRATCFGESRLHRHQLRVLARTSRAEG